MGMPVGAPMCDYQGLVAAPGVSVDGRRLLEALGVARYDFCHMPKSQAAFSAHVRGASPSWISRLPFGYEAYAHDKNAESGVLKDLAKRRRKAEAEFGRLTFTALSRSRSDFDKAFEWKRAQFRATGQTDVFAVGWTQRLMEDLFVGRDPEFGGGLFTLHMGDRLVAAQFHLRGFDVIHGWVIAHDPEYDRYSPGLLLFQDIMRWMDETPYTSIDYGPGDYRFKKQLANAECLIGHGFIGRPSPASFIRGAAYGIRETAERLPLGRVSELPGKAMRRYDLIRGLR
jgi:CelD/BcsL family acetyltransferase involved in cellulose biosynthesis